MTTQAYTNEAVTLLAHLIATPSVSRDERRAADIIQEALTRYGFTPQRETNNVWAIGHHYNEARPTLLLNAHLDTVKPVSTYTRNPYEPSLEEGMLYGLGSNDCGGGLVSLLRCFESWTAPTPALTTLFIWHRPKKRCRAKMVSAVLYRYCLR